MAHNGGRLQVNLTGTAGYYDAYFLNAARHGNRFSGVGSSDNNWFALLNNKGLPTAMPAGGGAYWQQSQIWIYGEEGDTWDLEFDTDKTVTLVTGGPSAVSSAVVAAGHLRYTITTKGTTLHDGVNSIFSNIFTIRITAMSSGTWTHGIHLYKSSGFGSVTSAEYADLIAAGEVWHPDFLRRLGYGTSRKAIGYLRFMDQLGTNGDYSRTADDLKPEDYHYWGYSMTDVRHFAGTSTKTLNHYTTGTAFPGSPAVWADGQPVCFYMHARPSRLASVTVTNGNPTNIQSTAHGLTTGEKVSYDQSSDVPAAWNVLNAKEASTGLPIEYTVTVVDPDNFTIALNSTGFAAPTTLNLFPVITVTDGTLSAKRCYSTGFQNPYNSEFAGYASGGIIHGRYTSEFDCIIMAGDRGGDGLYNGLPVEIAIDLCTQIGAHPWLCCPFNLNQTGRRAWLQRIKDRKAAWQVIRFEFGNEPWNLAFRMSDHLESVAFKAGYAESARIGNGIKFTEFAADLDAIFGVGNTEYKLMMNIQNASLSKTWLEVTEIAGGDPANYPVNLGDGIAPAPYYSPECQVGASAASYPGWLEAMQAYVADDTATAFSYMATELRAATATPAGTTQIQIAEHISTYLVYWIARCAEYDGRLGSLVCEMYEGNCHVVGADSLDGGFPTGGVEVVDVQHFWRDYLASSEQAHVITVYMNQCWNLGVRPSMYGFSYPITNGGTWGVQHTNSYPFPETPPYDAIMAFNDGRTRYRLTTS